MENVKSPEKIDPENTQRFVKDILEKSEKGIYRVEVKVGELTIPIDVYPEVFPPKSDYSVSSRSLFETFGDLKNQEVLDIGSGSGIESIVATLSGAKHVDATDISQKAIECTKHNIELNNLSEKVTVTIGDLFSAFPNKKYNLIIANLPIVDFNPKIDSVIVDALYDPGLDLHKRLFAEAKEHLNENGIITFSHSNLQSRDTENPNKDFEIIEEIIADYGYKIFEKKESEAMGFKWINYKIKLIQN
jgi:ribosomal protein L3 glutamine methyltransferase